MVHTAIYLVPSTLGKKGKEANHTVLLVGQRPTVALTVLAQLYGLKAKEKEMGAILFPKNCKERMWKFF